MRGWKLGQVLVAVLLIGCGVPKEALRQAQQETAAATMPAAEEGVRAALRRQAEAWTAFCTALHRRELGGIWAVDAGFVDLAEQTAAIARRQAALMDAGADDPALNRAMLEELQQRWDQAQRYLEK